MTTGSPRGATETGSSEADMARIAVSVVSVAVTVGGTGVDSVDVVSPVSVLSARACNMYDPTPREPIVEDE